MKEQIPDDVKAYHEAGHAVVAYRSGRSIELGDTTIDDEDKAQAQMKYRLKGGVRITDAADDLLATAIAGPTAVCILEGRPPTCIHPRDTPDLKTCYAICGSLGLNDAQAAQRIAEKQEQVHKSLSEGRSWRDVQAVAQELRRRRRLTREDVASILQGR